MKKVMLLGDSIRLGYREKVAELLPGRAEVMGPNENCRFSAFTLWGLQSWVPDDDYDVIQWNNGQWDTCHMPDGKIHTPLAAYLEIQERIAAILRKKAKRLVFATTTPVWPEQFEKTAVHPRRNEDIDAYNEAVVKLMKALGVEVNDLNSALKKDIKRYISEDMVHLNPAGIDLCAQKVVDMIREL